MKAATPQTADILGQEFHKVTVADVIDRAKTAIDRRSFAWCVTVHVDMLMKMRRDAAFRDLCRRADLVVADGAPILWAARLLGDPLPEKVSGSDLVEPLVAQAARSGHRLFFLGGQGSDARRAATAFECRHPSVQIVGTYSPPIGFEQDALACAAIQRMIRDAGTDILVVGLGAPKQEQWIAAWAEGAGVSFAIGVGITFSYVAGTIKRAPSALRRCGLEWLWRLFQEPRRLWRRYLVDDMPFFVLLARQVMVERRRGRAPSFVKAQSTSAD